MIDGKPVANASMALRLNVTEDDIKRGAPLNPYACAIALAARRQPDIVAAKVHLSCLYLLGKRKKHWLRYRVPEYATREIVAYDRGGRFVPGEIDLQPISTRELVRRVERIRGATPKKRGRKPRPRHMTQDVRASAYANEPPAK
jgi:hypothetical protein